MEFAIDITGVYQFHLNAGLICPRKDKIGLEETLEVYQNRADSFAVVEIPEVFRSLFDTKQQTRFVAFSARENILFI